MMMKRALLLLALFAGIAQPPAAARPSITDDKGALWVVAYLSSSPIQML